MMKKVILISIICGFTSGMLSAFLYGKFMSPQIVTADVKGIVEAKRLELFKRFQDKEDPDKLSRDYASFLQRLDSALGSHTRGRKLIIMRREAVIDGEAKDITEDLKKEVLNTSEH